MKTVAAICPVCGTSPAASEARGKDFEYGTTGNIEWRIMKCDACGTRMLSPRPADEEFPVIYPPTYYAYDFMGKDSFAYRVKAWLDRRAARGYLRGLPEAPVILDVGCGDGRLLDAFARQGVPADRLHGIELDRRAVERARAKGFHVEMGTFESSDGPEEFFDLIVLQQVIEHVSDPVSVLKKLRRLLTPGGKLVIETPNTRSWDRWLFRRRYWGGYHFPRHFFLFDPSSLTRLLERAGFEVVAVRALVSPAFWNHSFHHWLEEATAPVWLRRWFPSHAPRTAVLAFFTALDAVGAAFGVTSNMRVSARKA